MISNRLHLGCVAVLLSLLVFIRCGSLYKGYKERESGLYFKLNSIADSEKRIKKADYLQFKYVFKNYSGDTIESSRILLQVNEVYNSGGLLEALSLMNEQEQASAIFPYGSLAKDLDGAFIFPALKDTSLLFVDLQIDKIYSESEFIQAKKEFIKWLNTHKNDDFATVQEEARMDDYERVNRNEFEKTANGLRYRYIKKGKGEPSGYAKRVKIEYEGSFLNGKVFNSTTGLDNNVQDFYIGQEMQVIKGIEEALMFMREGDEVELLIPSWLAFGKEGSSTGVVPANTPVKYHIKLVSVN